MIRAGWRSLGALLVWGMILPVIGFWVAAEWRQRREARLERERRMRCRLCRGESEREVFAGGCPFCGAAQGTGDEGRVGAAGEEGIHRGAKR